MAGPKAEQVRRIYAIGNELGIVGRGHDDLLHSMICGMFGKESVKELTEEEAKKLIWELGKRKKSCRISKPARRTSKPAAVSDGQQRKIWALMYQLAKVSPSKANLGDRLCGIIKRELHMDAWPDNPFRWMKYQDGSHLVEILKGYIKSAELKASSGGVAQ